MIKTALHILPYGRVFELNTQELRLNRLILVVVLFFPFFLFSQETHPDQVPVITISGNAVIYDGDNVVSVQKTSTDETQKLKAHRSSEIFTSEKPIDKKVVVVSKKKFPAKVDFNEESKKKKECINRIATSIKSKVIEQIYEQGKSKSSLTTSFSNSFRFAINNQQQQDYYFLGVISDFFYKKAELIYQRKIFFYNDNIDLLNFSEQFSVRPPPGII